MQNRVSLNSCCVIFRLLLDCPLPLWLLEWCPGMGQCCFWARPEAKFPVWEGREFATCWISEYVCFEPWVRSSREFSRAYLQLRALLPTAAPGHGKAWLPPGHRGSGCDARSRPVPSLPKRDPGMGTHHEFVLWLLPLSQQVLRLWVPQARLWGSTCVWWSPLSPGTTWVRGMMQSGIQAVPDPGGRALVEAAWALLTGVGNEPLCTDHEISHV